MDKRTRILIVVLAALVLAGGGYYGYVFMTAEKAVPSAIKAAAPKTKAAVPTAVPAPGKPAVPAPGVPAAAPKPGAVPAPVVPAPPPAPVAAPAQKEAIPAEKTYTYTALGKRDPFMSPLEVPKVYPRVPANARPMEKVPTESLQVKAIMWNEKGYRALVVAPDGRGYTVKVGDTIGNKGGKILRMSDKRIYVTEKITDILGDVETRNIVLKLYKEAE